MCASPLPDAAAPMRHPLKAVLFDLDGTLLDIDLGAFLRDYFSALGEMVAEHFPGREVLPAILTATEAMQAPHPGSSNQKVFARRFEELTGIDIEADGEVFDRFYAERFPALGAAYGPHAGARDAVLAAGRLGLSVVVATQPIFPRAAIEHRLAWAGLGDLGLGAITTYEVMHACKPLPDYFREAAAMAGARPVECIMVGDDRSLDMPASDVGMRTFYVGTEPDVHADWRGDLTALTEALPALVEG
jgi:FMN phosphatase YigB (HAD superfamily)